MFISLPAPKLDKICKHAAAGLRWRNPRSVLTVVPRAVGLVQCVTLTVETPSFPSSCPLLLSQPHKGSHASRSGLGDACMALFGRCFPNGMMQLRAPMR